MDDTRAIELIKTLKSIAVALGDINATLTKIWREQQPPPARGR